MPFKNIEKRREYINGYMSRWRDDNRSEYNEYQRDWRRDNKDRVKVIKQRYERKLRRIGENAKAGIVNEE